MQKQRQRSRVARVLSYGKSHGTQWKSLNGCILAGSFLLLASVALLQLLHALEHNYPSSVVEDESGGVSVSYTDDGRSWKRMLWEGGAVKEGWERMERKLGNPGPGGFFGMGGHRIKSEDGSSEAESRASEEDDGELENEMDMEDEDGDEEEDASFDGEVGEFENDRFARGLQEEKVVSGSRVPLQKRELMAKEVEDHSVGMFSSDDEPLDEETRDRLEHMSNIEDVLMLNKVDSISKTDSSGKRLDELLSKKEKEAKLLLDPMNPENNQLLQDPDSVHLGGGLSKDDRALLKAFKWGGLATQSTLESEKKLDDRVQVNKKEVKKKNELLHLGAGDFKELPKDVRVMDDGRMRTMSKEQYILKSEPVLLQYRDIKGDASSQMSLTVSEIRELQTPPQNKEVRKARKMRLKDNMRGWGAFGSNSKLTFSTFMERFLSDKTCSLRVFMAWMTPPWSFTVKHQRALESLLYFHPTACVVVFTETLELDFFESFVEEGYLDI
jgi:hypothetical protein